jgi:hypothetical protein
MKKKKVSILVVKVITIQVNNLMKVVLKWDLKRVVFNSHSKVKVKSH